MRRYRYWFLVATIVILCFNISGCSSSRSHKTLSFFFDGVPDTTGLSVAQHNDSVAAVAFAGQKKIPSRAEITTLNYHPPYKEKQCTSCHAQSAMGKNKIAQPALCYQCHTDFSTTYKKVHGPVAAGYCTLCHNPHMGDNKQFLIRKGQQLCLHCHVAGQVLSNEAHKDIADANCTECHNPHGGEDRTMLK
jgi:predicted CXXCH cytochrome family protein